MNKTKELSDHEIAFNNFLLGADLWRRFRLLVLLSTQAQAQSANWPQWRGPQRNSMRLSPQGMTVIAKAAVLEHIAWTPPTLVGTNLYVRDMRMIVALDLK